MSNQITNRVLMISPDTFGFNAETSASNDWQHVPADEKAARDKAISEFNHIVSRLKEEGIEVVVLPSRTDKATPDAVFSNNWVTIHEGEDNKKSKVMVYPMMAVNRRAERQTDKLVEALAKIGITDPEVIDLSEDENDGNILEGTGSLVLDRKNKIAYASESSRTTDYEFDKWCGLMGYEGVLFFSAVKTATGNTIYYTNMLMAIGDGFAVLCPDAIVSDRDRQSIIKKLKVDHEVIEISTEQMNKFASKLIHLKSKNGDSKIFMSQTAYDAFTDSQRETLEKYGKLVVLSMPTIEDVGGGSLRSIITEIFPPNK